MPLIGESGAMDRKGAAPEMLPGAAPKLNRPLDDKSAPEEQKLISDPQLELHISRPELQTADLADVVHAGVQIGDWPGEDMAVEGIEHLAAEIHFNSLVDGKQL